MAGTASPLVIMTDYASWIERARLFVDSLATLPGDIQIETSIAPPLTEQEADKLASTLPMGLPQVLRDFMTKGSAGFKSSYWWEPSRKLHPKLVAIFPDNNFIYGGPSICQAKEMADLQESRLEWAEEMDEYHGGPSEEGEWWKRCTPFAHIANGDNLALDTTVGTGDHPVVYLSHDGESSIISPSFHDFLRHWEQICYVGPEHWLLSDWLDEAGILNSSLHKTRELRSLLSSGKP